MLSALLSLPQRRFTSEKEGCFANVAFGSSPGFCGWFRGSMGGSVSELIALRGLLPNSSSSLIPGPGDVDVPSPWEVSVSSPPCDDRRRYSKRGGDRGDRCGIVWLAPRSEALDPIFSSEWVGEAWPSVEPRAFCRAPINNPRRFRSGSSTRLPLLNEPPGVSTSNLELDVALPGAKVVLRDFSPLGAMVPPSKEDRMCGALIFLLSERGDGSPVASTSDPSSVE
mmetsp:Transcript_28745/g.80356  ORF Transcript_28745/g.80356 Transcript_28745/m.80356 type:complete len:225 (-) Transcript_28745:1970-2644(-)